MAYDATRAAQAWRGRLSRWRERLSVPATCRAERDAVLRARVGALAPVLAVLTLGWIPLDWFALPHRDAAWIAVPRIAMALALLALPRARGLGGLATVRLFVAVQAIGFGLIEVSPAPDSASAGIGYGLFPFVVAAQLAVFPMTWPQTLRAAIAPVAMLAIAMVAGHRALDARAWNDAWLLALLMFVAAWTAQAQLDLLVGLLGARREASHDALTGLANRRHADARLEAERARCRRHGEALSVLLCDLDRFKLVNDRYGHAAGDVVLAATARAIAAELRASDLGARYGGEEFVVILPETDPTEAAAAAERIRARIAALRIDIGGTKLAVTVSIGIASLQGDEGADGLLARADAAMYVAKSEGRDRCVSAPPTPVEPSATT